MRQEVNSFYEEVNKVKSSFSKEMSLYTDNLRKLDFGTDTKVKSIAEQLALMHSYVKEHQSELNKQNTTLETHNKNLKEIYTGLDVALNSKLDIKTYYKEIDTIDKKVKRCAEITDDALTTIRYLENYLEKYQPIRVQN